MSVRIRQFAAVAVLFAVPALALAAAPPNKAEKVAQRMLGLDKAIQEGAGASLTRRSAEASADREYQHSADEVRYGGDELVEDDLGQQLAT